MASAFGFPGAGHYDIVFVTTELFPFTAGGIGVLYGNLVNVYARPDSRILVVNASLQPADASEFANRYPHAALANISDVLRNTSLLKPSAFDRTAHWHYLGYLALHALLRLRQQGITWDVVEFQDFGGLAATTLLARRGYRELDEGRIAVRVHGPESVLRRRTPRGPWRVHAVVMDLERRAFELADLVVCHSHEVLAELEGALLLDLQRKSVIQRPPVGQVNGVRARNGVTRRVAKAVFASKLDPVKAPEVFLEAAGLLKGSSSSVKCVVLADHLSGTSSAMPESVADALSHVTWRPKLTQDQRRDELAESLVVIPSPFEAFCLLAYEAALLGGRPVLSRANPAFAETTIWQDGVNCWKFDGTSRDLARVLVDHSTDSLSNPLSWQHEETPYWRAPPAAPPQPLSDISSTRVGVIVTNRDLERYAPMCFGSLVGQTRRPDQVIVVDDGSRRSAGVFEAARALSAAGIEVVEVRHPGPLGLAAARNSGLRETDCDLVAFLDVDDIVDLRFFQRAEDILRRSSADVVVPYVGCFADEAEVLLGSKDHVLPFIGTTHHTRFNENLISSAFAMVRRSCLPDDGFDERFRLYEDWDLWLRVIESGARIFVDVEIGLWYRQRADGMAAQARGATSEKLALDLLRTSAVTRGTGHVAATILTDFAAAPPPVVAPPVGDSSVELALTQAELDHLRMVQQESAAIIGRKVVRAAVWFADLRHGRRKRQDMRNASVVTAQES